MKTLTRFAFISFIPLGILSMTLSPLSAQVRQITTDPKNHDLDNNQNFSKDGKWLLYDTRQPGLMESRTVEKVNIETGEAVVLYTPEKYVEGQGPGSGAASFSPADDRVVFIHGPWAETGLSYDFTVRRGGLVSGQDGSGFAFADARDITPPFTPGALRGGTHRHEWDGSGQWLGFTYNDDIMKKQQNTDLRTIGVTHLGHRVVVEDKREDLFEGDGEGFSALVVEVVPDPKPGTDQIFRAAEDSWVGLRGYLKPDGTRQLARAFIGKGRDWSGGETSDVFIVDIPEDITQPGSMGPLEGTETAFPAPPKGASQRRLTWFATSDNPGATGTCWSSPEGDWITFLAKDKKGTDQIFALQPTGGDPLQVTDLAEGVACSPRWSPDGKRLVAVDKSGRLFIAPAPPEGEKIPGDKVVYLTGKTDGPAPIKPVWSTRDDLIAFNREVESDQGAFLQIFVIPVPKG
jgi:hypothetical protein